MTGLLWEGPLGGAGGVAVVGRRTLTYGDLAGEVARVRAVLVADGVAPGDRVGLLADRSVDGVVGVLGILSSGAAYVPLDPTSPPARNASILRDAGAERLLVGGRNPARATPILREHDVPAWSLDPEARVTSRVSALPDAPSVAPVVLPPEALAALLYTSGTTGTPKGVMLSHRAIGAFAEWARETFALSPSDRVPALSPLTFDLSTFELFSVLSAGAELHVAPPGTTVFPRSFADFVAERALTVIYAVPSVLSRLLDGGLSDAAALRAVLFAGEVFPLERLRALMSAVPEARFANLFGPTETNVCTWWELDGPPPAEVPIGWPSCGDEAVVVQDGAPADEGELWIAGPTLCDGYWGRPELTDATFVEADFGDGLRRWLRTGDRVVRRPDGALLYRGRGDTMLKHQGFRIQPEEVEGALASHEAVEAALVAIDDGALVARVELRTPVAAEELRAWCERRVPRYMVPDCVVVVDALARTSTGKLRR